MRRTHLVTSVLASVLATASLALPLSASSASAAAMSCGALTKTALVADGFTSATGPVVTPYNYAKVSANPANALGTTYDFGAKALVVSCVSPADIAKLSALAGHPHQSAAQYMAYLVAQSSGAMVKTPVGGTDDYLDFGNGKQDGLGSSARAFSVRLDAWVAHNYIFLTFITPVTSPKAPTPLVNFVKWTLKNY